MRHARELLDQAGTGRGGSQKKVMIEVMVKPGTQAQLSRRAGYSPGLVSDAIKELARDGVVDRSRGDKVRLASMRGVAVGIDIGFNHTSVVARPLERSVGEAATRRGEPGINVGLADLRSDLLRMVQEVVEETGQAMTDVVSAGVAVPRMIDSRTGRFTLPVLPPWEADDDPAQMLSGELRVPVAIDNDANLGVVAEQIYGSDDPVEHIVYVKASTGVGVGIMLGPNLVRGQRGMAGEIGHLIVERGGRMCLCGGRGCLDTVIGSAALIAKVEESHRGTDRENPVTLAELVAKASRDDAVCRRVLNDAGRVLGFALAQLCNLINPHRIVIGGELSSAGDIVLEPCGSELRRHALYAATCSSSDFELGLSALSPFAEAHGALVLGLRTWSSK
ncbi:ROK family transcriptional regulator [Lentzea sp. NBC_00516]|uniref:ROK family transcriptional regulator n=1 Tax=Lentzea sp. NBC_00516 TaxID=2903582 RepID=UPI002E8190B8|nr:ROK family transcriptional regulator [Lentzea sp. NBC_00516]WUD28308.1 ROK family transcriptional regulator [Lentzea sp. NBC_00516]